MAKQTKLSTLMTEKYLGVEPLIGENCTESELLNAFNWYNYVCDADKSKEFVAEYLKFIEYDKESIKKLSLAKGLSLNTGWMSRILLNGGSLPDGYQDRMMERIKAALKAVIEVEEVVAAVPKNVISIQERLNSKTSELIGDLEEQIDIFLREGKNAFNITNWLRDKQIKPQTAQKIVDYYKPLYAELFDAYSGKDDQLKEAYSYLKKIQLRSYMEFIRSFVAAAEVSTVVEKAVRKPRKKKIKPVATVVAKVKYKVEDTEFKVVSIKPAEIVGAQQLWVFNTKYRDMSVYNAMGSSGLTVKGTTIIGFDEKTSITKKLRKPEVQISVVKDGGKIALRKLMESIKCKPKTATGRLNSDVIILKAIK